MMVKSGYLFLLLHMGLTDHPATRQQCNLHGKGKGKHIHITHLRSRINMTVERHACCKAEKAGLIIDRPACQVYFYMMLHQNRECRSRDRIRV